MPHDKGHFPTNFQQQFAVEHPHARALRHSGDGTKTGAKWWQILISRGWARHLAKKSFFLYPLHPSAPQSTWIASIHSEWLCWLIGLAKIHSASHKVRWLPCLPFLSSMQKGWDQSLENYLSRNKSTWQAPLREKMRNMVLECSWFVELSSPIDSMILLFNSLKSYMSTHFYTFLPTKSCLPTTQDAPSYELPSQPFSLRLLHCCANLRWSLMTSVLGI